MAQVVIAVRGGPHAKSRCAEALSRTDRAALTAVMLEDMLAAVAHCAGVSRTWVVTPTFDLADLARRRGASVIHQHRADGLNAALRLAISAVSEIAPYESLALMPGDLPLLRPEDLAASLMLTRTHAVALAPCLDGGTGLIVLRSGAALMPAFGVRSFQRHAALAERRGLTVAVINARSLCNDIDRADDLFDVLKSFGVIAAIALMHGGRDRCKRWIIPRDVKADCAAFSRSKFQRGTHAMSAGNSVVAGKGR